MLANVMVAIVGFGRRVSSSSSSSIVVSLARNVGGSVDFMGFFSVFGWLYCK